MDTSTSNNNNIGVGLLNGQVGMSGVGAWPGGMNMNMNVDMSGMGNGGDTANNNDNNDNNNDQVGSAPQRQQSPQNGSSNFAMAGNVFLGAGTPRSGF